jgi:hypothetical protein
MRMRARLAAMAFGVLLVAFAYILGLLREVQWYGMLPTAPAGDVRTTPSP